MYTKGEPAYQVFKQFSLGEDSECEETHRADCLLNCDAKVTLLNHLREVLDSI